MLDPDHHAAVNDNTHTHTHKRIHTHTYIYTYILTYIPYSFEECKLEKDLKKMCVLSFFAVWRSESSIEMNEIK